MRHGPGACLVGVRRKGPSSFSNGPRSARGRREWSQNVYTVATIFPRSYPEAPKLRSVIHDLEPTVANGNKIVRALRQSTEVGATFIRNDVPTKYEFEDFGGMSVDMFSNEFRALLSWIVSPVPSSICFSNSRMESMLTSRPMLSDPTCVSRCKIYLRMCLLTSRTMRFHDLSLVADRCGYGTIGTSLGLDRGGEMRVTQGDRA